MRDPTIVSYAPPFLVDEPMSGHTMKEVVKSKSSLFKEGDYVYGLGTHEQYVKLNDELAKAYGLVLRNEPKTNGIPVSNYVGILGMPGMTA
jgi:NADPH-dependent curcumin reductase CurA